MIEALKPLGIRVSMTVCGLDVYLADEGVPTISDVITVVSAEYTAAQEAPAHDRP